MLPLIKCSVREYERQGCPLMLVRGLEVVALDRVIDASGFPRNEALKRLAASPHKLDAPRAGLFAGEGGGK